MAEIELLVAILRVFKTWNLYVALDSSRMARYKISFWSIVIGINVSRYLNWINFDWTLSATTKKNNRVVDKYEMFGKKFGGLALYQKWLSWEWRFLKRISLSWSTHNQFLFLSWVGLRFIAFFRRLFVTSCSASRCTVDFLWRRQ